MIVFQTGFILCSLLICSNFIHAYLKYNSYIEEYPFVCLLCCYSENPSDAENYKDYSMYKDYTT